MAQLRIVRNAGVFGKLVNLDVLVDGRKVATLREGEQRLLEGIQIGARVHVEMQGYVRSQQLAISETYIELECGANWWLVIDWMDFCYIPVIREHVFYLRPLASSTNEESIQ